MLFLSCIDQLHFNGTIEWVTVVTQKKTPPFPQDSNLLRKVTLEGRRIFVEVVLVHFEKGKR